MPIPEFMQFLVQRLVDNHAFDAKQRPNQLIVNEYMPGQGINPHIDDPAFEEPIATVSLLSPATMTLVAWNDRCGPWKAPSSFVRGRSRGWGGGGARGHGGGGTRIQT